MKLQPDRIDSANVIGSVSPEGVTVNGQLHARSVIVPSRGDVVSWECGAVSELRSEHVEAIVALRPEVVLLGSGTRLQFPSPAALRPLIDARIGVETMDTAAACRTYNVLVSEGRTVVAALIVPPRA